MGWVLSKKEAKLQNGAQFFAVSGAMTTTEK
jgi:hypothetical protein